MKIYRTLEQNLKKKLSRYSMLMPMRTTCLFSKTTKSRIKIILKKSRGNEKCVSQSLPELCLADID